MKFEINDLKSIGEALEGIVEKLQEQFAPVAFDITLEYPGFKTGDALLVRMTSLPNEPWRFEVDITEKPRVNDQDPSLAARAETEIIPTWPAREVTE